MPPAPEPTGADGYDVFVRHAGPGLLRLANSLTGHRADAEDLTQETLVRICLRWGRLRQDRSPVPYAHRTMINLFLNEQRRRGYERRMVARLGSPTPVQDVHEDLALQDARALLAALPAKQRAAVAMRYVLDLDDEAIAAALRCSTSTVRSQIARGLESLRRAGGQNHDH